MFYLLNGLPELLVRHPRRLIKDQDRFSDLRSEVPNLSQEDGDRTISIFRSEGVLESGTTGWSNGWSLESIHRDMGLTPALVAILDPLKNSEAVQQSVNRAPCTLRLQPYIRCMQLHLDVPPADFPRSVLEGGHNRTILLALSSGWHVGFESYSLVFVGWLYLDMSCVLWREEVAVDIRCRQRSDCVRQGTGIVG